MKIFKTEFHLFIPVCAWMCARVHVLTILLDD